MPSIMMVMMMMWHRLGTRTLPRQSEPGLQLLVWIAVHWCYMEEGVTARLVAQAGEEDATEAVGSQVPAVVAEKAMDQQLLEAVLQAGETQVT